MPARAVWLALAAAALFGASTPLAKALVGEMPPVLLAGLLYLGSGLGLMTIFTVRRLRGHSTPGIDRPGRPWLAAAIVFGGIMAPVALVVGLRQTTGAAAALLLNLEGLFTAGLAWFVFKENFDRRIAAGMALILAGGIVLIWPAPGTAWTWPAGALLVAAASLCWAIDNNLTQRVSGGDPILIAGLKGLCAGVVNVTIEQVMAFGLPGSRHVAAAMILGLLGYGVSLVFFIVALRGLGTARTGAYFSLAPFIGAGVAILLLREPVTWQLGIAAALMAAGVWLHLTERHEHDHTHEPLVHSHAHRHDEHHQHAHAPGTPPEPHSHTHTHAALTHRHPHYPDLHHRHRH
jgi:drug/metabolite transporter (DMT)-like permease